MAYALTHEGDDQEKDDFYSSLEQTLQRVRPSDVVLCLGDFNAVTGTSRDGCSAVVGPFGSGTPNNNTERLLDFCLSAGFRAAGS